MTTGDAQDRPDDAAREAAPARAGADPLLVIRVGSAWLALRAELVEEICAAEPATPVPRVPDHIPGLINLRGYAVPLLNLRRFLALGGEAATPAFERIVIVFVERMRVGLLCDRVRGVSSVERSEQQPIRVVQGEKLREFARAEIDHPDGMIALLDLPRLLNAARVTK